MKFAKGMIEGHANAQGKEIQLNWKIDGSKSRSITVAGEVAFLQNISDAHGSFEGRFADLHF